MGPWGSGKDFTLLFTTVHIAFCNITYVDASIESRWQQWRSRYQQHVTGCRATTTACRQRADRRTSYDELVMISDDQWPLHQTPPDGSPGRQTRHLTYVIQQTLFTSQSIYGLRRRAIYTMSQKSSTSYFLKYIRAGLTDCKNFNGYRVRDNKWTQGCNQCFNF